MYVYVQREKQLTLQTFLSPRTATVTSLLATMPSQRAEEEEGERDGRGCNDGEKGESGGRGASREAHCGRDSAEKERKKK